MIEKREKYCKCLFYSSNALSRIMTRIAEEEFAPTGLAPSYAFLLMIINDQPGIQPTEISNIMMLNPSTVTRFVEKMVDKGFLKKRIDGKSVYLYPLEKSTKINSKLREAWLNLYKRYTKILGETQANILTISIYESALKLEKK
jgi:DNA-binding MarR family transcriptional regulator